MTSPPSRKPEKSFIPSTVMQSSSTTEIPKKSLSSLLSFMVCVSGRFANTMLTPLSIKALKQSKSLSKSTDDESIITNSGTPFFSMENSLISGHSIKFLLE